MKTTELIEFHGRGVKIVYRDQDREKAQKGVFMGETDNFIKLRVLDQSTMAIAKTSVVRINKIS